MGKQFGSQVRELRKGRGLSLRQLAEAAGLDFTYVSKVETGKIPPPSEEAIVRLAAALGADADELLSLARKVDKALHDFVVTEPDAPRLLRAWKDGDYERAERIIEESKAARKEDVDPQEP